MCWKVFFSQFTGRIVSSKDLACCFIFSFLNGEVVCYYVLLTLLRAEHLYIQQWAWQALSSILSPGQPHATSSSMCCATRQVIEPRGLHWLTWREQITLLVIKAMCSCSGSRLYRQLYWHCSLKGTISILEKKSKVRVLILTTLMR